MRQWKWCQQGLGFPGPHYTGGLRERIILIHSYFESFSTAFTCCWWWWFQVLGALVFALFVLVFDCVFLLPLAETDDSVLHS